MYVQRNTHQDNCEVGEGIYIHYTDLNYIAFEIKLSYLQERESNESSLNLINNARDSHNFGTFIKSKKKLRLSCYRNLQ